MQKGLQIGFRDERATASLHSAQFALRQPCGNSPRRHPEELRGFLRGDQSSKQHVIFLRWPAINQRGDDYWPNVPSGNNRAQDATRQTKMKQLRASDNESKLEKLKWPELPVNLVFSPAMMQVALEVRGDDEIVFYWRPRAVSLFVPQLGNEDSYNIRERFLRVRDREDAFDFLRSTGVFVRHQESSEFGHARHPELTMTEFKTWQGRIRRAQVESLAAMYRELSASQSTYRVFLPCPEFYFDFDPEEEDKPSSQIRLFANTTVEAIVNTVLLDEIGRQRFRICALPSCSNVFQRKSKHRKMYCDHACARKANKQKVQESKKANSHKGKRSL
jgi:predicted RNA-binding Zn ribbon-like protein